MIKGEFQHISKEFIDALEKELDRLTNDDLEYNKPRSALKLLEDIHRAISQWI